jgi:hypothetical protein
MDRAEKKRIRDRIGERLDVASTRITDDEALMLDTFLSNYDEAYGGRSETRRSTHVGWSSEGKYVRKNAVTDTFTEEPGIRRCHKYEDDDGQSGESCVEINDARGILNYLKGRR